MKNKLVSRILDILMIVCVLFVFLSAVAVFTAFSESSDYDYNVSSFHYSIQDERYFSLLEMANHNRARDIGGEEFDEYYAVADYFEAYSNYVMYRNAGDESRMNYWNEKMLSAESQMGILSNHKEEIKAFLEKFVLNK